MEGDPPIPQQAATAGGEAEVVDLTLTSDPPASSSSAAPEVAMDDAQPPPRARPGRLRHLDRGLKVLHPEYWGNCPPSAATHGTAEGDNSRRWRQIKANLEITNLYKPATESEATAMELVDISPKRQTCYSRVYIKIKGQKVEDKKHVGWFIVVADSEDKFPTGHQYATLKTSAKGRSVLTSDIWSQLDQSAMRDIVENMNDICQRLPVQPGDYSLSTRMFLISLATRRGSKRPKTWQLPQIVFKDDTTLGWVCVSSMNMLDHADLVAGRMEPLRRAPGYHTHAQMQLRIADMVHAHTIPVIPTQFAPADPPTLLDPNICGHSHEDQQRAIRLMQWLQKMTHSKVISMNAKHTYVNSLLKIAGIYRDRQSEVYDVTRYDHNYVIRAKAEAVEMVRGGRLPYVAVPLNFDAVIRVLDVFETTWYTTGDLGLAWERICTRADFEQELWDEIDTAQTGPAECLPSQTASTIYLCSDCVAPTFLESLKIENGKRICPACRPAEERPDSLEEDGSASTKQPVTSDAASKAAQEARLAVTLAALKATASKALKEPAKTTSKQKSKRTYKIEEFPLKIKPKSTQSKADRAFKAQHREALSDPAYKAAFNRFQTTFVLDAERHQSKHKDRKSHLKAANDAVVALRTWVLPAWQVMLRKFDIVNDQGTWHDEYANKNRDYGYGTDEDSREKKHPFNMSFDALMPVFVQQFQVWIHAMENLRPTAYALNEFKFMYGASILRQFCRLYNKHTALERQQILERISHLYLIRLQLPFSRADRMKLKANDPTIQQVIAQTQSGVADPEACLLIERPWMMKPGGVSPNSFSKFGRAGGARVAKETKPFENLERTERIISEIEDLYEHTFTRIDGVVYLFNEANKPTSWTWSANRAVYAECLSKMTKQCNQDYLTTCTADTLFLIHCIQVANPPAGKEWLRQKLEPYVRHPLSVSFGHAAHGVDMTTGIPEDFESLANCNLDNTNIEVEPWIWNLARFKYDHYRDEIEEEIRNLPASNPPYWDESHDTPRALPNTFWGGSSEALKQREALLASLGAVDGSSSEQPLIQPDASPYTLKMSAMATMLPIRPSSKTKSKSRSKSSTSKKTTTAQTGGTLLETAEADDGRGGVVEAEVTAASTSTSLHQPVGLPDCGNLSNESNICYVSAVIQIFARVPGLRALIAESEDFPFDISTGRGLWGFFKLGDPGFAFHQALLNKFRHILALLEASNDRIPASVTLEFMSILRSIDTENCQQFRLNDEHDPFQLLSTLLSILNNAGDRSDLLTDTPKQRPNYTEEVEQKRRIAAGESLDPLAIDVPKQLAIWHAIGNDSLVERRCAMQVVQESLCPNGDCLSPISRSFGSERIIKIELPEQVTKQPYRLTEALERWSKGSAQATCERDASHGKKNLPLKKIIATPEVLIIHVGRLTLEGAPDPQRGQKFEDVAKFNPTPLIFEETLDLAPWCDRQLPSEPLLGALPVTSQQTRFKLDAVATWRSRHWFTCAKAPDTEGNEFWALFDDTQPRVRWNDILKEAATGRTNDTILVYSRLSTDNDGEDSDSDTSDEAEEEGDEDEQDEGDAASRYSESEGEPVNLLDDVMPFLGDDDGFPGLPSDEGDRDDYFPIGDAPPIPHDRESSAHRPDSIAESFAARTPAEKGQLLAHMWKAVAQELVGDPTGPNYTNNIAVIKACAAESAALGVQAEEAMQQAGRPRDPKSSESLPSFQSLAAAIPLPQPDKALDPTHTTSAGPADASQPRPSTRLPSMAEMAEMLKRDSNRDVENLGSDLDGLAIAKREAEKEIADLQEQARTLAESVQQLQGAGDRAAAKLADAERRMREQSPGLATPDRTAVVLSSLPTALWAEIIERGTAHLDAQARVAQSSTSIPAGGFVIDPSRMPHSGPFTGTRPPPRSYSGDILGELSRRAEGSAGTYHFGAGGFVNEAPGNIFNPSTRASSPFPFLDRGRPAPSTREEVHTGMRRRLATTRPIDESPTPIERQESAKKPRSAETEQSLWPPVHPMARHASPAGIRGISPTGHVFEGARQGGAAQAGPGNQQQSGSLLQGMYGASTPAAAAGATIPPRPVPEYYRRSLEDTRPRPFAWLNTFRSADDRGRGGSRDSGADNR